MVMVRRCYSCEGVNRFCEKHNAVSDSDCWEFSHRSDQSVSTVHTRCATVNKFSFCNAVQFCFCFVKIAAQSSSSMDQVAGGRGVRWVSIKIADRVRWIRIVRAKSLQKLYALEL